MKRDKIVFLGFCFIAIVLLMGSVSAGWWNPFSWSEKDVFYSAGDCYCNSCASCTSAINNGACTQIKLNVSITDAVGTCLSVRSVNKVFDCQGRTIAKSVYDGHGYGILLTSRSNGTKITNCTIQNMGIAVNIVGGKNFILNNLDLQNNKYGIYARTVFNLTVGNTKINKSIKYGITFKDSNFVTISNSSSCFNQYDLFRETSNNVTYSNLVCNQSKTYGIPVGTCVGSCFLVCECNSCEDCSSKLSNIGCLIVKLTANLSTNNSCISISGGNKIFDCQGHSLIKIPDSSSILDSTGIYVIKQNNNTIKNCQINNFSYGVSVLGSYNNLFENLFIRDSNKTGFSLSSTGGNILKNISIINSRIIGLWFYGAYNNTIINMVSYNNKIGAEFTFSGSSYNIIRDSKFSYNAYGIFRIEGYSNTFINTEFNNNLYFGIEIDNGMYAGSNQFHKVSINYNNGSFGMLLAGNYNLLNNSEIIGNNGTGLKVSSIGSNKYNKIIKNIICNNSRADLSYGGINTSYSENTCNSGVPGCKYLC